MLVLATSGDLGDKSCFSLEHDYASQLFVFSSIVESPAREVDARLDVHVTNVLVQQTSRAKLSQFQTLEYETCAWYAY